MYGLARARWKRPQDSKRLRLVKGFILVAWLIAEEVEINALVL